MNPDTITNAANPVADTAYADAWCDPEGRSAFERIVASERSDIRTKRPLFRRLLTIGGAVAVAAAAAAAILVVGGSGERHVVSHARPAAWIVTKSPDGTVTVAFRDYRDPKGLQARLRADGVRANVNTLSASCYPASLGKVGRYGIVLVKPPMSQSDFTRLLPVDSQHDLAIDPRSLPAGASIWVGFPPATTPAADRFFSLAVQPTDGGAPCPLQVAEHHLTGQSGYLVRPPN
jgi:hypothetical protein